MTLTDDIPFDPNDPAAENPMVTAVARELQADRDAQARDAMAFVRGVNDLKRDGWRIVKLREEEYVLTNGDVIDVEDYVEDEL